jgi:hypothetical protein
MTRRKVSFLQGPTAARYSLPAEDHRLNHAGLWRPDGSDAARPLRVQSGIVMGPFSPGAVTVVAGGVNVNPFEFVVQGTVNGTQGPYEAVSDAVEFRAITAASPTEFRRGYVVARLYDQVSGTDTSDDWNIEVVYGPNAATAGAAVLPTRPANSVILKEFAVSNTGVITLVGTSGEFTGLRGGILPVVADGSTVAGHDGAAGAFDGQYRHHPAEGLQAWSAARSAWDGGWTAYTPVWTASNGTPVLGNGTLTGRYRRRGRHVELRIFLSWGSTTNGATGFYTFSLPFPAAASGVETILAAKYNVATFGNLQGFGLVVASATVVTPYAPTSNTNLTQNAAQNRDASAVSGTGYPRTPADPFVTGANIALSGSYECA